MRIKKPLLLILFLTLSLRAFSTVFTITSNADSGPGTLRDALTQAALADSSVTNYIYFNLSDTTQAGRTIVLFSELPAMSSNLTIDAGTQPGSFFGVSTTKIALFFKTPATKPISGLIIVNKHDVGIFGLYMKNLTDVSGQQYNSEWNGINIQATRNIQIGKAGDGIVVLNFYTPLGVYPDDGSDASYTRNISIKASFFNVDADGETFATDEESPVTLGGVAGQVKIGGTAAEGNVLGCGLATNQENSAAPYDTITAVFTVSNNRIGIDYKEQSENPKCYGIYGGTTDPDGQNTFFIEDNVIEGVTGYPIFLINMGQNITILRNYIGTNRARTQSFKTNGIFLYWDTGQAAIGSTNPADANYITNCNPVTIWPYTNCTVNKNSFYCTVYAQPLHAGFNGIYDEEFPFPKVNILKMSPGNISGTATPNSSIELFYSDKCGTCSPQTYFASTTADANGNWQYSGNINGTIIASATLGKNTSDFTQTSINTDSLNIVNACGNGTGSIKGLIPQNAQNVKWVDSAGNVVGTSPDLLNVKVGRYKMIADNGSCGDSTSYYQIQNKFSLDTSAIKRIEPSCGNPTGSISNLNIINNDQGAPYLIWQDAGGKPLAYSPNLSNVPAGDYYLQVKSADSTCSVTFGPFSLRNVTGPNIDQSKAVIQSTNCGQSTGSITGLTATGSGTLKYIWWNGQQQTVATTADLLNQPAGTYKLEVTDDSQCGPVYTSDLTIPETNGITMDESAAQTTVASCNINNGSVTGIKITGATQYQWTDSSGKTVGTTPDLQGVAAGTYTLIASNGFGCTATSKPYTVAPLPPTKFPVYTSNIVTACYESSDGSITVNTDALVKSARWVNAQGGAAGTGSALSNVQAGDYQLYLTDQNGCENYYNTYTVNQFAALSVADNGTVANDQCTLSVGNISGENITGGAPPFTYAWYDSNNQQIGSGASISNLPAGNYSLKVSDTRCGSLTINYQVTDQTETVPQPSVSNVALCSSGSAIISVNNPSASSTYRLYANDTDTQPITEQKGGFFTIKVTGNTSFYVSQLNGSCESPRAVVMVTVGLSALNIANTFTPNGDGVNDLWQINGIVNYPQSDVQVFTRWGERVFYSKGYATPFDGTFNGKPLSDGVYYYIINLNTNCSLLSGSLTIIR